jgi:hypothetical protein
MLGALLVKWMVRVEASRRRAAAMAGAFQVEVKVVVAQPPRQERVAPRTMQGNFVAWVQPS